MGLALDELLAERFVLTVLLFAVFPGFLRFDSTLFVSSDGSSAGVSELEDDVRGAVNGLLTFDDSGEWS